MFKVTFTWKHLDPNKQKETIYQKLKDKLGREPTHEELVNEVRRISDEVLVELASEGKLGHQKR